MSRSAFALAFLVLVVLLSPPARAGDTDPGGHTAEVPPKPPWGSGALPKNTIGPSAPLGYLGGGGGVTPLPSGFFEVQ